MRNQVLQLVRLTVERFGSHDPFEILEKIGAIVYYYPLKGGVRGFTFWNKGIPLVCLNESLSASESRRTAAHELAHVLLHGNVHAYKSDAERVRECEKIADMFADILNGEEA